MRHQDEQAMLFYLLDKLDYKQSLEQVLHAAAMNKGDYLFKELTWDVMEAAVIGMWVALRKSTARR